MSVVVVTRDRVATVAKLLDHLHQQTAVDDIEVLLVGPNAASLAGADRLMNGFRYGRALAYGDGEFSRGRGTEHGVKQASATLIALTEDHSYPDPHWAERLIAAAAGGWAAVGASVTNANPQTVWSRVNHDLSYGRWSSDVPAGEIDDVPGFNSAFSREALLGLGADLEFLLDRITALHRTIRERGGRFAFSPDAALHHWSPSVGGPSIRAWFSIGRCYGDHRANHEQWPMTRRAMYAGAAPLIVLMRLRSHWRSMRAARALRKETPGYYATLAVILTAIGFGESYGYVAGEGRAIDLLNDFEFSRDRFLAPRDREAFLRAN